ncbi:hypothetical protein SASPL_100513 [Salvia splendens]|uniref:Plastid lipid-associated protein/fibrillin conserved domain-containing protein n=1 Tax=Salvia splendens TaxID=180675 RepID=A0A8X8YQ68_SALSN|nr:hypothetical protein SASPL_100513 [Salvia splendens]
MEVFVEMESHLAVTDRRVDSLHPPDFPGPEPPNAHSDWQQPTSGLLSGFNLPPQGQPIYPPVVSPPPPRAPMIPPCSLEDQQVSSCEFKGVKEAYKALKLEVRFTSAVLQGKGWEFPLPPFGQGWFETVYIDDEIRVVKDIRKDYLVVERAPYSWKE